MPAPTPADLGYGRRPPVAARQQARAYGRALRRGRHQRGGFVLFAQGRSGSSLLAAMLRSHPAIAQDDEVLYAPVWLPRLWVRGLAARHPDQTYGFKVKSYQLRIQQGITDPGRWLARLVDDGWGLVTLERHDVLRQTLSTAVAAATGTYHLRGDATPVGAVHVDPRMVVDGIRLRLDTLAADRRAVADLPRVEVVYERDLLEPSGHQSTADRVVRHLGLDPAPVTSPLRRISTHPSRDVANWDEVRTAVEEAGLAAHLAGT